MGAWMGCPLPKSALRGLSADFVSLATEASSWAQLLQSQRWKRAQIFQTSGPSVCLEFVQNEKRPIATGVQGQGLRAMPQAAMVTRDLWTGDWPDHLLV